MRRRGDRAGRWGGGAWALALLVGTLASACGGGDAAVKADTHKKPVAEDENPCGANPCGDNNSGPMIAPEKYDEISSVFRKKRPVVARCYNDAVQTGKLKKSAAGRVTVGLAISAVGKPGNVHVTESTLKSPEVEACIVKLVGSWDLPPPDQGCEFSFSYDFEAE